MEIRDMIELMKAVSDNGLTCFELEEGNTKLVMKREKKQAVQVVSQNAGLPVKTYADEGAVVAAFTRDNGEAALHMTAEMPEGVSSDKIVTCPLVGTFYSSPAPDAEDFVKVGDRVKKGQTIGIVEAMKLMNEIECEYDGVVEAILVKNEETVEYGQPLFRIR